MPRVVSALASARLTVVLLAFTAATVLVGAWCPQESQVGQEKVIEAFGPDMARTLIKIGVADIFHSPWFLLLIALLTVNIIMGSFKHVFPKLRLFKQPMPILKSHEIARMPFSWQASSDFDVETLKSELSTKLRRSGYCIKWHGDKLTGEFGKFGRLAPSITHVGLLTLLAGVTVTAWTGFSGFKPIAVGSDLTFDDAQHSKYWIGKLPTFRVHVNSSRREDYQTGEAKQWYSNLSVVDSTGKNLLTQDISVNNPLSFGNLDIYQSSWGLGQLEMSFNKFKRTLDLQPMGKLYAAFLPLTENSILIFSIRNQDSPVRIFAKRADWTSPRLIGEIGQGKSIDLGTVKVSFTRAIPVTGLQYKSDPGLAITFTAFAFIICGVTLAAVPHRQLWAQVEANEDSKLGSTISIGGTSRKAKVGFQRQIQGLIASFCPDYGQVRSKTMIDAKQGPAQSERANSGERQEVKVTKQAEAARV